MNSINTKANNRDKTSLFFACLLLLVSLISLGIASERWVLIITPMVAVILYPFVAERFEIELSAMAHLVLTLPFVLLMKAWPLEVMGLGFAPTFFIALYLQAIAIARLYSKKQREKISRIILCSSLSIIFCGLAISNETTYLVIVVSYAIFLFFTLRNTINIRSPFRKVISIHIVMIMVSIIFTITMATSGVVVLKTYYTDITKVFMELAGKLNLQATPGFSRKARLGTISKMQKGASANEIAVRVFAEITPGYLRGKVFMYYHNSEWSEVSKGVVINADRNESIGKRLGRIIVPNMQSPRFDDTYDLEIFPDNKYGGNFFLPLKTAAFDTQNNKVYMYQGNTFITPKKKTSVGYQVFLTKQVIRAESDNLHYLTMASDSQVNKVVKNIVKKIILPNDTVEEKVEAVRRFFAKNYIYKIGIQFSSKSDPMVQFLTEKHHGHCELFASAGTLMLRSMGIKARYVTGFVCNEKSKYGDLWLARNLSAHAWTEYYNPKKGWMLAEFTPANGIPLGVNDKTKSSYYEYLYSLWIRLKGFGIRGILDFITTYVGKFGQWLIAAWWRIACMVLFTFWYFIWRDRKNKKHKRTVLYRDKDFKDEVRLARERFFNLERKLKKLGFGRKKNETLIEFADRIEDSEIEDKNQIVEFIRQFSLIRYR